jgi:hypothetical protein
MKNFQTEKLALARQSMKIKLLSMGLANNVACAKSMLETELQQAMMEETVPMPVTAAVGTCAAGIKCFYTHSNGTEIMLTR